jgi:hypothetical protein
MWSGRSQLTGRSSPTAFSSYLGGSVFDTGYRELQSMRGKLCTLSARTSHPKLPTAPKAAFDLTFGGGLYGVQLCHTLTAQGTTAIYSTYIAAGPTPTLQLLRLSARRQVYLTGVLASSDFPLRTRGRVGHDVERSGSSSF